MGSAKDHKDHKGASSLRFDRKVSTDTDPTSWSFQILLAMVFSVLFVGVTSLFYSQAAAAPGSTSANLASFIPTERTIALKGALNNIGPNGSAVPGAGAGFVVASPSKQDPDYFFTWSRDAALTMKMIVDEFILGESQLQPYIDDYIHSQAVLQTTTNPSGTFLPAGLGLGEPKYQVDGSRFNEAWGRPQRDGPALRAITLITYSNWLAENGEKERAKNVIWPVISNDLSYVGQYWNQTGFDLWEEVQGSSFFTIQNQHRSLVQGAMLAQSLGVTCTGCDQAPELLCFLQKFWNGKYIVSNINAQTGRSGLDGNSILGPISIFDIDAVCDSPTMQPCHSRSLANFKALIDSFRKAYGINNGIPLNLGVAVGRYTEDTYMGGNPWYLLTTAAAEFLYDAVAQWKARKTLVVDDTSLAFFKDLYTSITVRTYDSASDDFTKIMDAITAYADSFVAVAQKYTPPDGSLAEQFNRNTGAPLSAKDLTWSYAAFVTMAERHDGQYPPSWGTRDIPAPPSTCSGTSTPGVYAPATAAGAPNVTTPCQVNVVFNVNASTYYGENLVITGSTEDLGSWNIASALPMGSGGYTSERPLWSISTYLKAGEQLTYKYARQENCGQPYIYESQDRTLTVPACGGKAITVENAWVGPTGNSGNC
ncbi:putative Glucoamylase P [Venustampulla echinocandica]|uniref:Glucoamylase n=1 Tax=Venustampulla echinocandica TaxID=2656787 RepID=A0A370T9Q4_9HELO|nr:putative Glucoamylase P [Venustampulla echinocandica]RDL30375.1 putative Glucoamylase P [Venustampulla echinocandica]